jgi:hypothetical protein
MRNPDAGVSAKQPKEVLGEGLLVELAGGDLPRNVDRKLKPGSLVHFLSSSRASRRC